MTSLERVLTTLGHREPDRVPLFLLFSHYGAKELGLPVREYFSQPGHVVEAQLRLHAKYAHDCLYGFSYAPAEIEAWGGEVVWVDDGPPTAGEPFLADPRGIRALEPPRVADCPSLRRVLETLEGLRGAAGGRVPIIGVVMSPFSLPAMQLGFDRYLELLYDAPELFDRLMAVNEAFCAEWANAQLGAGATAICYFDPVASPTCVPPELYRRTGFEVARRTLARIQGPTATHLASARALAIVDDLAATGTAGVAVGTLEDLSEVKASCRGRLAVLGNLNGLAMRHWTAEEAERRVRDALREAAPGGGFILADQHGEIPWQVEEETLRAVSEAVRRWGTYPIRLDDA